VTDLDELVELYSTHGTHHYDESVTQLDHGLQCAALARRDGASDELVVAALLHDVGHLLHLRDGGTGPVAADLHHEERGADLLATWFPPAVCEPVRLHVRAKRYLVAVEPGLRDTLSPGSQASLLRQGGPMTPDEVAEFERTPGHLEAVALRRWDDAGKVEGLDVAPFAEHEPLLRSLARA
jgi:gamma-butyrobetaine dioxygenase